MNKNDQYDETLSTSNTNNTENSLPETSDSVTYEVFDETPNRNNIFFGIIGAILCGSIGSILWIIIFKIGFIAGIAGFVIISLAFLGYEKLGGTLDKPGVVLCIIISFIIIYVANKLSWSWDILDYLKEDYPKIEITILDIFTDNEFFFNSEITFDFILDLVVGYGLTIARSIQIIKQKFR